MSELAEVILEARSLSRVDKLHLIRLLAEDFVRDEGASGVESNQSYPVWSPDCAFDAAHVMLLTMTVLDTVPE
ncbi:MAG TPA: hypothetical protein VFE47_27875 [Tepidisphaeraceae bacterium]|jgi:hypothetical protein|nr:hypothetical protein [Tepidisphaeraceae bacterium]